jgi:hypothetical protein
MNLHAQGFLPGMRIPASNSSLVVDYDFSNANSYSGIGTNVTNLSNANNSATLVNGPTFFTTPGYAFMDGVNDYMLTENLSSYFGAVAAGIKNTNFTINLWFNPKALNGVIVQEIGQTTPNSGFHASNIEMVNGALRFTIWPSTSYSVLISSTTLTLNNWYHVALTYDGINLRAYLNGVLIGSASVTRVSSLNTTGNLYYALGAADATNMGSGSFGRFLLSRFSVYNTSMTATDIASLYTGQRAKFDSLALITLDAGNVNSYPGTGTTWRDISGNANHITLTGATYTTTTAGGALFFDGTDYADFECGVGNLNTLTIELWVNTLNFQNGMYFGWNLYDVWTNNNAIGYNTGNSDLYGISSTQVSNLGVLNNWKHLVFVMNKSDYRLNKIYVNGVQQNLAQQAATQAAAQTNFNGGLGRIACWRASLSFIIRMNLSTFSIYANELSSSTILQRFTDSKSRYGL